MRKSLVVAVVGLFVTVATADPLKIIGFDTGGGITFQGATVSNYYTLEFATTAGGPWTNWASLTDQAVTGSVMTAPSPMFYRIRQADSSAFPPYAPSSNITASMLASNQVVKSINSLRDEVTISAGANITITPSGTGLVISASSPAFAFIPNMEVSVTSGDFAATVTQLTERVRALERHIDKVDLVLKMSQKEIDQPADVHWLEGNPGTNSFPNKPAHATGKPAPGR